MQTPKNLILLVTILNKYVFYIHKNSRVSPMQVNQLIELINEHISSIWSDGRSEDAKVAMGYFKKTLDAISFKKIHSEEASKFSEIDVG